MGSIRFMNVLEDRHIDVHLILLKPTRLLMVRVDFENARVDLSLNVRRVFFSTFDRSELNDSYEKYHKFMNI